MSAPDALVGPSSAGLPSSDDEAGGEIVRSFMLTRGRTRAAARELSIETIVSVPSGPGGGAPVPEREHRRICDLLTGPMSIAEVSAHLSIPLRAAVVLVSEMVEAGTLAAGDSLGDGDIDLLLKIRSALQIL
ncbi:DUF742 domain-containing protein [Ilumatobacter sp.]|uniref:DUF742 domain-containing protein n=1 Tax=Ilumatobacter sp. TaxID=1967498 RepID=UPI003B51DE98